MLVGCVIASPKSAIPSGVAIDAEAGRLMSREKVQGMALAVIDHGQVVHVAAYGYRNFPPRVTADPFDYHVWDFAHEDSIHLHAPATCR